MNEFKIKSVDSDLELVLCEPKEDFFKARVASSHINVEREVYAFTDAYGLANFLEKLAAYENPWLQAERWESLEGEFKISATCSKLGHVTFELELSHLGCSEEWLVKTQLNSELGQLSKLATSARTFLGP